jgi:hypothetical protein
MTKPGTFQVPHSHGAAPRSALASSKVCDGLPASRAFWRQALTPNRRSHRDDRKDGAELFDARLQLADLRGQVSHRGGRRQWLKNQIRKSVETGARALGCVS